MQAILALEDGASLEAQAWRSGWRCAGEVSSYIAEGYQEILPILPTLDRSSFWTNSATLEITHYSARC